MKYSIEFTKEELDIIAMAISLYIRDKYEHLHEA